MTPALPIQTPGVFPDIDIDDYHSERLWEVPCLSASVGKPLVPRRQFSTTPWHVRWKHPKLNPQWENERKNAWDMGHAAHEFTLGRGRGVVRLDWDNYNTKAAQAAKQEAYDEGKTPALSWQYENLERMKLVSDTLLLECPWGHPFRFGQAEVALLWTEKTKYGPVPCKALVDYLPNDQPVERGIDYKATGQSANPEWWEKRQMTNLGFDISACFHRRGYRALGLAHSCDYLWVVQEWEPPFACSIVGYSDEELNESEADIQIMIDRWAECLYTNTWPSYDMTPHMAKRPKWFKEQPRQLPSDYHLRSEDVSV